MSRPFGLPKTGGRKAGTPNKRTLEFRAAMEAQGFSIPEKALSLYERAVQKNDMGLELKVIDFIASYVYSKPKPFDDEEGPSQEQSEAGKKSTEEILRRINWAIEMEQKFPKEAAEARRESDRKFDNHNMRF